MHTEAARTIRRTDYTPPAWLADRTELEFDLDAQRTLVSARTRFRRNPAAAQAGAPLVLDGESLETLGVFLDGAELDASDYLLEPTRLTLAQALPEAFELRVVTALAPSANTALMGLYESGGNLFTQCEAEGFRRITWFPDRPDVMARYRVTLRGDRERFPVLLSNGNLVDQGEAPAGADGAARHFAVWDDPFPKPSYLFAVVAGRLSATERRIATRSGREVLLQVWVEPGNEERTGHAMQSLVEAIRWDEERFGLELDLDRFMIVAVGDFNMGAMENKGLNVFNTKYVFATPRLATDADFAGIEAVVGHEYFHNWTGNRVTCRDWFQLTLKEGLTVFRDQEFSADRLAAGSDSAEAAASARAVKRIEDVRLLRANQFPEDAGPMAHPIRPEAYQEINNFYTVTVYEKGAEVIRMLQTLVGRDGFRRGMDLYFQRHDGQAVTCDDFVAAIADANGRDLAQFGRWYAQAGTPRLSIRGRHDPQARTYTLEVSQSVPTRAGSPAAPLHMPLAIGLLDGRGRELPLRLAQAATGTLAPADTASAPAAAAAPAPAAASTLVLELTEARQSFVFEDIPEPPVPSLLRDFSAPVIVEYDFSDTELAFLAAHDTDPFNRWEAAQRLATGAVLRAIDGEDPQRAADTLVEVFARTLRDESLDPAFRELVLTLPGEGVIAEHLDVVDPARLRAARNGLRATLAQSLAPDWRACFERCRDSGSWTPDRAAAARRALKNLALGYWVQTGEQAAREAALAQFDATDNMTDRQAALQALVSAAAPQRDQALEGFAAMFGDEALAMDKWLTIQATMHRGAGEPPVLERVRALMAHPAFSMRNPNRVRALLVGFCSGNLAEFHAPDGCGHRFWAEQVGVLDALNPQLAARLARALDRWRKFTPALQASMRAALETVAGREALSGDLREIVSKALAS